MRARTFRIPFLLLLALALILAIPPRSAVADPGIGVAPGGPSPLTPGNILEPVPGAPTAGPIPMPVSVIGAAALGLPAGANVDDISYGDNMFPPPAPFHALFSVAAGSTGHPGSPVPPSLYPNVLLEGPAGGPGDFAIEGDIYSNYSIVAPGGPFGAFTPFPPAPCGPIQTNVQAADENGMPPFATGLPNVALGLMDLAPGPPPGPIDDLDALELRDNALVDFAAPAGVLDAPVFFTVDPATAAGLPALPPFFLATTAADVLAFVPGFGLVNWAPAASLGLTPADDIDALEVSYVSGAPIPAGWIGGGDVVVFSLAPGSPTNAALGSMCFGPGSGLPSDIYADPAAGGPPPFPFIDAEMLGLNTARSGGFPAPDDVDAIDFATASFIDADGDGLDDAADFDDDGDLVGDMIDNCPTVPNAAQTNTDAINAGMGNAGTDGLGDACDTDDDGDGYLDATETGIAENPLLYCRIMRADVDGDGVVTILDLAQVAASYGMSVPPAPARRNQDADTVISILDLSRQAGVYLQPVAACP